MFNKLICLITGHKMGVASQCPYTNTTYIRCIKCNQIYTDIKQYKMINNRLVSDSFMQFLCIIYAFYASFMHVLYAHLRAFVKVYYESDIKITGI